MRRFAFVIGLGALAAAVPGLAHAKTRAAPTPTGVEVKSIAPFGPVLTDAKGHSVYAFMKDQHGQSSCYAQCAAVWPPVTVANGVPPDIGSQVDASKLTTITRADGTQQLAYDGHPLYRYVKDRRPGQSTGQDVTEFGAEWYLVSPEGQPITHENR